MKWRVVLDASKTFCSSSSLTVAALDNMLGLPLMPAGSQLQGSFAADARRDAEPDSQAEQGKGNPANLCCAGKQALGTAWCIIWQTVVCCYCMRDMAPSFLRVDMPAHGARACVLTQKSQSASII
jgi:hypothetical protein